MQVANGTSVNSHTDASARSGLRAASAGCYGTWHTRGVIGIYPLLLIWAEVLIRRTKKGRRAGWSGFAACSSPLEAVR
jgi:hypothetical protein